MRGSKKNKRVALLHHRRVESTGIHIGLPKGLLAVFVLALSFILLACSVPTGNPASAEASRTETLTVRVASMKGPTSMGLLAFMEEEKARGSSSNDAYSYDFQILEPPEVILSSLVKGDLDVALVPANAASLLYQRSQGKIQVMNINTLGSLYVVSGDASVTSFDDLQGRTILMTGKGASPEYVMNTLLAWRGISDVRLEYKSEITELAASITANPQAIAIMPEPFVTSVLAKNPSLAPRLSLKDVWNETIADGSEFILGVTIVRTEFAEQHPQAVAEFLERQRASVAAVNADSQSAAQQMVDLGFIENAEIAAAAIPRSNVVYVSGETMQHYLNGYLALLFAQNPDSIGGALPASDFYYETS